MKPLCGSFDGPRVYLWILESFFTGDTRQEKSGIPHQWDHRGPTDLTHPVDKPHLYQLLGNAHGLVGVVSITIRPDLLRKL